MLMIRRVTGDSMRPAYRPGAIVFGWRGLTPRAGRVVVAEVDGCEVLKRIAKISNRGLYLLGDNAGHSTDSRRYGWLEPSAVKSVIFGSIER